MANPGNPVGPREMMTMARRFIYTAVALVIFSGLGRAGTPEYNNAGRDMYGNTVEQNDAIRLRGTEEKARFAHDTNATEKAENLERLRSLIPGAVLLTVFALGGAVAYKSRRM
jgi:hypothetical protein